MLWSAYWLAFVPVLLFFVALTTVLARVIGNLRDRVADLEREVTPRAWWDGVGHE